MDVLRLASLLETLPRERTRLLDNLGRLRREVGPITPELSDALADHMRLRHGDVHEVTSFYSFLQAPVDAVRVCTGPVCDSRGAREQLGAGAIEVPCLGHCDLAPVVLHGDEVVGGVTHSTNGFLLEPDDMRNPPELTQDDVLARLESSGLTGMGGAGFPTWRKWDAVRHESAPRVVIVNADEGEPGTIKDRYVLELRPQLLLEGLAAAMRFCETDEAYIYLREEYATARGVLQQAISERGLSVELVIGAGAYICGEETAMLESMEGRRGMPRLRPPFPAQSGYLGRPTLINNVETLAHVARILRGEWQQTRLWSVSGAVGKPGCYEAPLDVTLRELIDGYAGGLVGEPGAIVPGGAASGILPPEALDVPLTREALTRWGCGVGSAAVQVFPKEYSPLRLLAETMRFFAEESCQKCTPCRIGNRALHHVCEELEHGRAAMSREQVEEWLDAMTLTSICGLGQAAPYPVRNAFERWPELFAPLGPAPLGEPATA
ncbi:MAG: NADH-ubiquinone oxidoreductase-F iron-sulfur binding region domain-containing protein [Gaiellaceae bacterium]